MMTNSASTFSTWLNEKLRELNTDETVFGAYISGILEGDETDEEKAEALSEILSEIIDNNLTELIATIINKWVECHPKEEEPPKKGLSIDVNEQLAKLLEAQKLQVTTKERQYTEEERRIREQILAQYSQTAVSNDDEEVEDSSDDEAEKATGGLERNTNAHDVMQLQKERREQARQDSAAKKQKDKDDREKQKKDREEKKEKRKTVKGERRR